MSLVSIGVHGFLHRPFARYASKNTLLKINPRVPQELRYSNMEVSFADYHEHAYSCSNLSEARHVGYVDCARSQDYPRTLLHIGCVYGERDTAVREQVRFHPIYMK